MEKEDEKDEFKVLNPFLKVYGIYETKDVSVLQRSQYYFAVLICTISTLGYTRGAVYLDLEISEFCVTSLAAIYSGLAVVKISYLYWYSEDLYLLINSLKRYVPDTLLGRLVRKMVTWYIWMMAGLVVLWVITPMFSQQPRSPMSFYAPWENDSLPGFVAEYIMSAFCLTFECYVQITMDCLTTLLSAQICHKIKLLKFSMEQIGKQEPCVLPDTSFDHAQLKHIQLCIDEHIFIKKLIKAYERLVSVVYLIQIIASTVIIGITIFSVTMLGRTPNEIIKYIPIIIIVYCQVFVYCWAGENIKTYYNELSFSSYCSDWYRLPVPLRKCILLLLLNTTQPVQIKGWYLVDMGLTTFLSSIQQSWSYFMLLYRSVTE